MYQYHTTSIHQTAQYPTSIKKLKLPEELANYALTMAIIAEQCNGQDPYDYILEMAHTQYTMKQGMKVYEEEEGKKSVNKELEILCVQDVFRDILYESLTPAQREMALNVLMFMTQKRDGSIKSMHRQTTTKTMDQ